MNTQDLIGTGVPAQQIAAMIGTATAGSTGSVTLNTPTGIVKMAAAASSLTLTNSYITANSLIFCTVQTSDGTAKSALAVPAAGSATIVTNAAATGTTNIAFWVVNR